MGKNDNIKLTSAAVIVMSSTVVSRITGYAREALIPTKLGVGTIADAFNVAFGIPNLMYQLLLGGALAAALIPILSGYVEKKQEQEGWKVVGTFINVVFLLMLLFCVLGMIFTPQLIPLIASGFNEKGEATRLLAIKLTRILLPSVAFLMLAGMCNGVLNSYYRFAAAAYGPVLYNIGGALSLFILGNSTERSAERVAYGFMLSAFIYFLFQMFSALRNFKYYRPRIYLKHPGFFRMLNLAIPSLISSTVIQINALISLRFASFAAAGSITMFSTADKTWQLPLGIFGQSVGIALLPSMSAKLALGNTEEYKSILSKGLKTVLFLSIPSSVAFIALREPIIRTLFKFNASYSESKVEFTAYILMFFSLALVAQSVQAVMGRAFFAANDTKTPLYIGLSTIAINWICSYAFYHMIGVAGMALAASISSAVYSILLIIILNRKMKGIHLGTLAGFITKVLLSAGLMGVILYITNKFLPLNINSKLSQILNLGFQIVLGTFVYLSAAILFKMEEAMQFYTRVVGRVRSIGKKLRIAD